MNITDNSVLMKNEKWIKAFVLFFSSLILLINFYLFSRHLDFFLNKKKAEAEIISMVESVNHNGIVISAQYYDEYKQIVDTNKVLIKYSIATKLDAGSSKMVTIIYTKWFNQFYLMSYKIPGYGVFLIDLIVIMLMYFGIKYGLSRRGSPVIVNVPSIGKEGNR